MPYTLCPVCGEFTHLNIGDPGRWFEERGRLPVYPGRCLACFTELSVGDRVEVRVPIARPAPATAGEQGVIEAIWSHPGDGSLYKVRLDSGREAVCWRAALRWRKPVAPDAEPGAAADGGAR
jgi:hypothetical protein